jgi:hypothetical protein
VLLSFCKLIYTTCIMKSLYVAGTHEAAALVLNVASIMPDLPVLWYQLFISTHFNFRDTYIVHTMGNINWRVREQNRVPENMTQRCSSE